MTTVNMEKYPTFCFPQTPVLGQNSYFKLILEVHGMANRVACKFLCVAIRPVVF